MQLPLPPRVKKGTRFGRLSNTNCNLERMRRRKREKKEKGERQ